MRREQQAGAAARVYSVSLLCVQGTHHLQRHAGIASSRTRLQRLVTSRIPERLYKYVQAKIEGNSKSLGSRDITSAPSSNNKRPQAVRLDLHISSNGKEPNVFSDAYRTYKNPSSSLLVSCYPPTTTLPSLPAMRHVTHLCSS